MRIKFNQFNLTIFFLLLTNYYKSLGSLQCTKQDISYIIEKGLTIIILKFGVEEKGH